MSTQLKPARSRITSSRSQSIKSGDPRPPSIATRSATTHPIPPFDSVRRNHTVGHDLPQSAEGGTVHVRVRPLLGRAPPRAQFEMVTPPRSPPDPRIPKEPRLALRPRLTNPSSGPQRLPSTDRSDRQEQPSISVRGRNPSSQHGLQSTRSSMIPVRRNLPVLAWTKSQASLGALDETYTDLAKSQKRTLGRGALPKAWMSGTRSQNPSIIRQNTVRAGPPEPMAEVEPRRAKSDPDVKPDPPSYPRLAPEERVALVSKLMVLLNCIEVESEVLYEWEQLPLVAPSGGSRSVFGTSVKDSSLYASFEVILGEHSHNLPICVFASVEEICRRGTTTPALFRSAPPPNKRTLQKLVHAFDQGPSYGAGVSLANEDISNICALLKLYLRGLPKAVLSYSLWPALKQVTLGRTNDAARIAAIQAILHLQHRTSFSLLIYILAFLHQLVLHGPQNGLDVPTLAGIFGPALFAPRTNDPLVQSGCMLMSPEPDVDQILVKTFQSAQDVSEGTRVMQWVLEHWDEIATGLLSLDILHGTENEHDIREWEAKVIAATDDKAGSEPVSGEGECGGGIFRAGGADGELIDEHVEPEIGGVVFPFPDTIKLERVPVREVRDSIVEMADLPQSTRASSPATLWSQDTALPRTIASRSASLQPAPAGAEPAYVLELRQRIDAQEAEIASLRQELASIRSRLAFPPNNTLGDSNGSHPVDDLDEDTELNEDMMPTPRPLSGPFCAQPLTMRELVDSLESVPVTPLFHQTMQNAALFDKDHDSEDGSSGESENSEDAPLSSVSSDSGPGTPLNEPCRELLYVVNPDSDSESTCASESGRDKGQAEGLVTARNALRSALAVMHPIQVQLKAVEEELQLRGVDS